MRSLAAAYAVLALLAMPALLWAADEPPATTTPATTEAAPAPAPAHAPAAAPQTTPPATGSPPPASPAAAPPPASGPSPASPPPSKQVAAESETRVADADAEPVARAAASGGVTIEDFSFAPRTITVDVGDTVTWTNRDSAGHTATADDGSFDTGLLSRGQSGSKTFDEAGTFAYHCAPHPNMTGTVVVRAAGDSAGAGPDDPAAAPSPGTATPSGSSLPATGLQVGIVALGGVLLLGAGAALRRRLED